MSETLNWKTSYPYTLSNGYPVQLAGWTHTRPYAGGFLCNAKNTNPRALVSGLKPGKLYAFKVYQYAAKPGANGFKTTVSYRKSARNDAVSLRKALEAPGSRAGTASW